MSYDLHEFITHHRISNTNPCHHFFSLLPSIWRCNERWGANWRTRGSWMPTRRGSFMLQIDSDRLLVASVPICLHCFPLFARLKTILHMRLHNPYKFDYIIRDLQRTWQQRCHQTERIHESIPLGPYGTHFIRAKMDCGQVCQDSFFTEMTGTNW